ncbi:hypothetical protein PHLCEN_2v11630, partial [Hermanssonia centrifuga]
YNVSELVLHANHQVQDAPGLGEDFAMDPGNINTNKIDPSESALATQDEIGNMNNEYLLKYIKMRLNSLFQSVDLEPAPMNNFPWLTLPMKLADGRVMLCGWPRSCRHPASGANEGRGNKGMSSLHLHERRILANAFGDTVVPLTIRKIDHSDQPEDNYLKSAPPFPDERAPQGTRTLVRKQNHKTVVTDHRGPQRLETIPDSPSTPDTHSKADNPKATRSSIPLRKRRRVSEAPKVSGVESEDDDDNHGNTRCSTPAAPSKATTKGGQHLQPTAKKARIVTPDLSPPGPSPPNSSDDSVIITGYNTAPVVPNKVRKKAIPQRSAAATTVRRKVIVAVPPGTRSMGKKRKLQLESDGENEITDSDIRTTYPKSEPSARVPVKPRPAYHAAAKDGTPPMESERPAKTTRSLRGQTATTPQPQSSKLRGKSNQRTATRASAREELSHNEAGPSNQALSETQEENPSLAPVSDKEMVALFQMFLKNRGV